METTISILGTILVIGFIIYIATRKKNKPKKGGANGPTPKDTPDEV